MTCPLDGAGTRLARQFGWHEVAANFGVEKRVAATVRRAVAWAPERGALEADARREPRGS